MTDIRRPSNDKPGTETDLTQSGSGAPKEGGVSAKSQKRNLNKQQTKSDSDEQSKQAQAALAMLSKMVDLGGTVLEKGFNRFQSHLVVGEILGTMVESAVKQVVETVLTEAEKIKQEEAARRKTAMGLLGTCIPELAQQSTTKDFADMTIAEVLYYFQSAIDVGNSASLAFDVSFDESGTLSGQYDGYGKLAYDHAKLFLYLAGKQELSAEQYRWEVSGLIKDLVRLQRSETVSGLVESVDGLKLLDKKMLQTLDQRTLERLAAELKSQYGDVLTQELTEKLDGNLTGEGLAAAIAEAAVGLSEIKAKGKSWEEALPQLSGVTTLNYRSEADAMARGGENLARLDSVRAPLERVMQWVQNQSDADDFYREVKVQAKKWHLQLTLVEGLLDPAISHDYRRLQDIVDGVDSVTQQSKVFISNALDALDSNVTYKYGGPSSQNQNTFKKGRRLEGILNQRVALATELMGSELTPDARIQKEVELNTLNKTLANFYITELASTNYDHNSFPALNEELNGPLKEAYNSLKKATQSLHEIAKYEVIIDANEAALPQKASDDMQRRKLFAIDQLTKTKLDLMHKMGSHHGLARLMTSDTNLENAIEFINVEINQIKKAKTDGDLKEIGQRITSSMKEGGMLYLAYKDVKSDWKKLGWQGLASVAECFVVGAGAVKLVKGVWTLTRAGQAAELAVAAGKVTQSGRLATALAEAGNAAVISAAVNAFENGLAIATDQVGSEDMDFASTVRGSLTSAAGTFLTTKLIPDLFGKAFHDKGIKGFFLRYLTSPLKGPTALILEAQQEVLDELTAAAFDKALDGKKLGAGEAYKIGVDTMGSTGFSKGAEKFVASGGFVNLGLNYLGKKDANISDDAEWFKVNRNMDPSITEDLKKVIRGKLSKSDSDSNDQKVLGVPDLNGLIQALLDYGYRQMPEDKLNVLVNNLKQYQKDIEQGVFIINHYDVSGYPNLTQKIRDLFEQATIKKYSNNLKTLATFPAGPLAEKETQLYKKIAKKYPDGMTLNDGRHYSLEDLNCFVYEVLHRNRLLVTLPNEGGLRQEVTDFTIAVMKYASKTYGDMDQNKEITLKPSSIYPYHAARDRVKLAHGEPSVVPPSLREQEILVAAAKKFSKNPELITDYFTAQIFFRARIESVPARMEVFLGDLSFEDGAVLVENYFGSHGQREFDDPQKAFEISYTIGRFGFFRETRANIHIEENKFVSGILTLGHNSSVSLLDPEKDFHAIHTHPQSYFDHTGKWMGVNDGEHTFIDLKYVDSFDVSLAPVLPSRKDIDVFVVHSERLSRQVARGVLLPSFIYDSKEHAFKHYVANALGYSEVIVKMDPKQHKVTGLCLYIRTRVARYNEYVPFEKETHWERLEKYIAKKYKIKFDMVEVD